MELWKLTDEEILVIEARGGNVIEAKRAKRQAYLEAGGIILNPDALTDLYEALEAWDKLRAMHPLDSGCDIDKIFWECCDITDKALAKAKTS